MWVITERGEMYSAVNSYDDTHKVVRARDKRSIRSFEEFVNALRDGEEGPVEVLTGVGTDYEYRVNCDFEEWEAFMANRVETGNAKNVKNAVADALGKDKGRGFLRAMMETWSIWYSYQEAELRKTGRHA